MSTAVQEPIENDPILRIAILFAGLLLVAFPGLLSALSIYLSDGFLNEEPETLTTIRAFTMQVEPTLADGMRSASQAVTALLAGSWFRRGGRLSPVGWASLVWLLACAALGLWGSATLGTVQDNNVVGGAQSLRLLRGLCQTTTQSAFTYVALLVGLSKVKIK
jgi:hypothetical protein